MKRVYITTIVSALLVLAVFGAINRVWERTGGVDVLKVGFIYKNDESTPYTYSFMLAQEALEQALPGRVQVFSHSNVSEEDTLEPLQNLVHEGCSIIFTNNNSPQMIEAAREYPNVQFCQGAYSVDDHSADPDNYHSFAGAIYEGRYVTGVAAGMKLREMIDNHVIGDDQALVGYIGAYPIADVISGYTAFLMGVRSVVPQATMRVYYTNAWNSYNRERLAAKRLIDEGCVVISHHTDTNGSAVACEDASVERPVVHVGYNVSMIDVAPTTALIGTRINWTPYVIGAVNAVLEGKSIERTVPGRVFGNDMCAGFDQGWVEVTGLNRRIAANGTESAMNRAIEGLSNGEISVFKGDYVGVDPEDPTDTVDLSQGYVENERTSWPTFHYVLKDIITVEE